MDFFDIAMGIEKEGEQFYTMISEKCAADEGISTIFKMLADDERKHYSTFKRLKANNPVDFQDSDVFSQADHIFKGFRETFEDLNCDNRQLDLYKKALDLEKKSYEFYLEKLGEFNDAIHKGIIRKVANEEKRHVLLIENIIELVERPKTWIENAEFFHREDY